MLQNPHEKRNLKIRLVYLLLLLFSIHLVILSVERHQVLRLR